MPFTEKERVILRNFGQSLRKVREAQGLSQAQLAKRTGLDRKFIEYLELGDKEATLLTMNQLALALDEDLMKFLPGCSHGDGRKPSS